MDAKARLAAAEALRAGGRHAEAAAALAALARDPGAVALGDPTAAGLPRRLLAAMLRLAKAEGDTVRRVGLQAHLVPPPGRMAPFADMPAALRATLPDANRMAVPRVIHQIWIGPLPLPATCAAWATHATRHGLGYRLWREADLAALGLAGNPAFAAMMARGDYPGAVDLARYAILGAEGGIYLDCDFYPARESLSFDALLPLTGLCAMAEDVARLTGKGSLLLANSFIAVPRGHPAMLHLNAVLPQVVAEMPKAPAWWATGPLIFTLVARCGSVALAGDGMAAGDLALGVPLAKAEAFAAANEAAGGGLLLAWKSW